MMHCLRAYALAVVPRWTAFEIALSLAFFWKRLVVTTTFATSLPFTAKMRDRSMSSRRAHLNRLAELYHGLFEEPAAVFFVLSHALHSLCDLASVRVGTLAALSERRERTDNRPVCARARRCPLQLKPLGGSLPGAAPNMPLAQKHGCSLKEAGLQGVTLVWGRHCCRWCAGCWRGCFRELMPARSGPRGLVVD